MSVDSAFFRQLLMEKKQSISDDMAASTADSAPVELDQSKVGRLSRMDALQVQAMAKATAARRGQELRRIEAALSRIDEGEYGYCLQCDELIAEKRLEFDPSVVTCIQCASKA